MGRLCVVFAGGPVPDLAAIRKHFQMLQESEPYIVCADRGYDTACRIGVRPDLIVGDFDSCETVPEGIRCLRYPPQKDDTDTLIAVKEGFAAGCTDFILYGALGGRLDHSAANFQVLRWISQCGGSGRMFSADHLVLTVDPSHPLLLSKSDCEDAYISVFAACPQARGVTLRGLAYEVEDFVMTDSYPIGTSNRLASDQAEISVREGMLFVVISRET